MKKFSLLVFLMFTINSFSQNASCEDLMNFVKKEGRYQSSIGPYNLDSDWLYEVTAYSYENKYYVIAKIKKDKNSYTTKSYIFCGIPYSNWSNFKVGSYSDPKSYGERFHKYIMDYQCNCK